MRFRRARKLRRMPRCAERIRIRLDEISCKRELFVQGNQFCQGSHGPGLLGPVVLEGSQDSRQDQLEIDAEGAHEPLRGQTDALVNCSDLHAMGQISRTVLSLGEADEVLPLQCLHSRKRGLIREKALQLGELQPATVQLIHHFVGVVQRYGTDFAKDRLIERKETCECLSALPRLWGYFIAQGIERVVSHVSL